MAPPLALRGGLLCCSIEEAKHGGKNQPKRAMTILQAIYDEDGLLTSNADFRRALQSARLSTIACRMLIVQCLSCTSLNKMNASAPPGPAHAVVGSSMCMQSRPAPVTKKSALILRHGARDRKSTKVPRRRITPTAHYVYTTKAAQTQRMNVMFLEHCSKPPPSLWLSPICCVNFFSRVNLKLERQEGGCKGGQDSRVCEE